jgi:hypothetical protein
MEFSSIELIAESLCSEFVGAFRWDILSFVEMVLAAVGGCLSIDGFGL